MATPARGSKRKFARARKGRLEVWTGLVIALLVIGYALIVINSRPHVAGDRLRLDSFIELAENGRIRDARILDQDAYVTGTYVRDDGSVAEYSTPYLKALANQEFLVGVLLDSRVPTTIDQQFGKRILDPTLWLIPVMVVVILLIYLIRSYMKGTGLFGLRSGARRVDAEETHVRFSDVAGQDAAVTELREVRDFLSNPERFDALGALIPKGILLYGPPGCGKTLLARALAGEAGAAFYSISGSDFVELYVGVGAARVRDLFKEARENTPSIVFIDELDSIGRRRRGDSTSTGSSEEQEQALNQILAELDGFSPLSGTIVIGATNRPDVLDPALLRPGRLDRTIGLERPSEEGRLAILEIHARNKPLAPTVDLGRLANQAIGLSGADLASVMNEGALLAARAGRPSITQVELDTALQRILEAPERQRRLSMRQRSFGRSSGGDERVGFDDVAGMEEVIAELAEVKDYLDDPERYAELGARPPRGFLLVGPPGCGKTLLARAVATEANAAFFAASSSEFVESLAGEGAARVRDLFAEAKATAPSIIFLDEIDAIGARRGGRGNLGTDQTLNQILIELDGFDARAGVMVMAASNRPEILDEALVRPGRFDRTVTINPPDRKARQAILAVHARGKRLAPDVDLAVAASLTQGFSGADLANVMNEAALLAARAKLTVVPMAMLEEAVDRIGSGISRGSPLTGQERAMVAYHEAGHALVARALPGTPTPHKVSLIARDHQLGSTRMVDTGDRLVHPRSVLLESMATSLGGRAAEELVFGEPGAGAVGDLARVHDLARRMVCDWGMSRGLGPRAYPNGVGADGVNHPHSDEAARQIDVEIGKLIDEAYQLATGVLSASRDALDRVARALIERETLSSADLDQLTAPAPAASARAEPGP